MNDSIAAIVVTYNRLSLLQECIRSLRSQIYKVDYIIIINNGSNDGTEEWLKTQSDIIYITQNNRGGSWGYYTGIKYAYNMGCAWFWCMDDDTILNEETLDRLVKCKYYSSNNTGFLASLVLWKDGLPHHMNLPEFTKDYKWLTNVMKTKAISIVSCSFVSVLISMEAVKVIGLPLKEFFIWYDDIEYTLRISKQFYGYLVLDSIAFHLTADNSGSLLDRKIKSQLPRETYHKYYCGLRNKIYMARLREYGFINKFVKIHPILVRQIINVCKGLVPPKMLMACIDGLRFNPKVDHIIDH